MTSDPGFINAAAGTPSITANEMRLLMTGMFWQGHANRFAARGGVLPNNSSAQVDLSGTTITVRDLNAVVSPALTSDQGSYIVQLPSETHPLSPADASNPRKDIVVVRIYDDDEDASTRRESVTEYIVGTPSGTPSEPAVPTGAIRLATIDVPVSGGGSATLTENWWYTVAQGGILPVRTSSELPTGARTNGMAVYRMDTESLDIWHGSTWATVGSRKGYQLWQTVRFTANGAFTKGSYSGIRAVKVKCQGGGGAGGGAEATSATQTSSGGGGGGGVFAESWILESALSASHTVTVGAGGTAAAGAQGGTGGTTSFGSLVIAPGGTGGFSRAASTSPRSSSGASQTGGGTGDFLIPGGGGGAGMSFDDSWNINEDYGFYGQGGSSHLGNTSRGARGPATSPAAGGVWGGGGSGAVNGISESSKGGGAGGAGIVIVEIYV